MLASLATFSEYSEKEHEKDGNNRTIGFGKTSLSRAKTDRNEDIWLLGILNGYDDHVGFITLN